MAQWMSALATKPYNLSSIPRSHLKVEGELCPIQPPHTHTHTHNTIALYRTLKRNGLERRVGG